MALKDLSNKEYKALIEYILRTLNKPSNINLTLKVLPSHTLLSITSYNIILKANKVWLPSRVEDTIKDSFKIPFEKIPTIFSVFPTGWTVKELWEPLLKFRLEYGL